MIHALNMVWNPAEGIDLGFFMLRFYSLSWVLAFGLGWYVMKPIFMRENETVESLDKLFVYTIFRKYTVIYIIFSRPRQAGL